MSRLGKYCDPAVAEPRQSAGHCERASDGDSDSPARLDLSELAAGITRVLQERIGNNSEQMLCARN